MPVNVLPGETHKITIDSLDISEASIFLILALSSYE